MAIRSEWTKVTPAMAIEYLSHAAPNRPRRKSQVEKYARDMSEHRWLSTGESLLFTASGELIDGQHRLLAVIESGETIEFLIVRGVAVDAMQVIDSGIARTFADGLSLNWGHSATVGRQLAAITRRGALWDSGVRMQTGAGSALSHGELLAYLNAHPEIEQHAQYGLNQPRPMVSSLMGFVHYMLARLDNDQADDFCEKMRLGAELAPDSPILHLRDRLSGRDQLSGYHMAISYTADLKVALCFRAWNIVRQERGVGKLQLPKGGLTNKNFPVPK
jgi:hypothetical protein